MQDKPPEVTALEKMGELWAGLYIQMAQEFVDSFGAAGEEALRRAIRAYGRKRGQDLRATHLAAGLPINLQTLIEHYDMPTKCMSNFEQRWEVTPTEAYWEFATCPYAEVWERFGRTDLGLIYCLEFHPAMYGAYAEGLELELEMPEIITKGDSKCVFRMRIKRSG